MEFELIEVKVLDGCTPKNLSLRFKGSPKGWIEYGEGINKAPFSIHAVVPWDVSGTHPPCVGDVFLFERITPRVNYVK